MSTNNIIIREGGINWTWYCEVAEITPTHAKVIKHWRLHNFRGDIHPHGTVQLPFGPLFKETKERMVTEINIPGHGWRKVSNPDYIFNYDGE